MFIAYRSHPGKVYTPTEWDDETYSGIAVFSDEDEVPGLRYANEHGLKLIKIESGQVLKDLVVASRRYLT